MNTTTAVEDLTDAELGRILDYRGQHDTCSDDFARTAARQEAARDELACRRSVHHHDPLLAENDRCRCVSCCVERLQRLDRETFAQCFPDQYADYGGADDGMGNVFSDADPGL